VAPEGTVVNCIRPAPISIATVGTIQIVNNLSTLVLSKLFGASEKYKERATAVWHGSHAHVETHGLTEDGEFFVAPLTDTFCGAAGARAFRDGVDMGGEIPNIVSRWANVESQELNTPIRYLFRRAVPDSGGPGKYRGGVCHEYAFTPNRTGGPMGLVLCGMGTRAPMSLGIMGGYPGCNVGYSTFRRANIDELPSSLDDLRGESREDQFWGQLELEEGDVQYVRFMGGGGYGDPIDRDPALVLADVRLGLVGQVSAHGIYGVVAEGAAVDEEATAVRRREIRTERLGREPEGPEARRSVEPSGLRMSEYLQRTAAGATQCTWCGSEIAVAGRDWKDDAVLRRIPVERAGPLRTASGEFFLVEACCPACGTLLDTDLAAGDDPPLHDRITRWPG
jgi:N-methylhydantoinase B